MRSFVPRAAALAAALSFVTPALAHHPDLAIGGGGGIVTAGAGTLEQGHFGVGFQTQYVRFSHVDFGALQPGEDTHELRSLLSPSLSAAYGITNDLMLSVRLPWVRRSGLFDGHVHEGGTHAHVESLGDSSGLGDITLLGQYRFLNKPDWGLELAALLGVKLPTGRTNERARGGERFETEFQPGSGSWDGLFGLAASKNFGAWSLHANLIWVLAGTGSQHTDLGDRLIYNAAVSWRIYGGPNEYGVTSSTLALDAVLEMNGEWHAQQRIGGERDPNSGGNVIYISPGLRGTYRGTALSLSFGVPLLRDMNGLQSKPQWRVFTALSTGF